MLIAIGVHGRFHAFDLARGLIECGADVRLFTNYPGHIAARFGIDQDRVRSFVTHGVASRLANQVGDHTAERLLHTVFGHWLANELDGQDWYSTNVWSSVATEWLSESRPSPVVIHRGSAHISAQRQLLDDEERRVGVPIDKPTDWMIDREEAEYARASLVVVPSTFAAHSFKDRHLPATRVCPIPLATADRGFKASDQSVAARVRRVAAGEPLHVLYVGTLSYQKGMFDLEAISAAAPASSFQFRLVGPVRSECERLAARLRRRADVRPAVSREDLLTHYEWADVLVLPSIQDGFAVVLTQAAAAGVPFIASSHSGGPDLLENGSLGWVLPPRDPDGWLALLLELEGNRAALAEIMGQVAVNAAFRTWRDVGCDLLDAVERVRLLIRP